MRFSVIIFLSLVAGPGPQPWVLSRKVWPRHELTVSLLSSAGQTSEWGCGVMWQLLGGQSGDRGPIPDRPARQTRPIRREAPPRPSPPGQVSGVLGEYTGIQIGETLNEQHVVYAVLFSKTILSGFAHDPIIHRRIPESWKLLSSIIDSE